MSYFLSETFLENNDEYHPIPVTRPLVNARCASCGLVIGITDAEFLLHEFFSGLTRHDCKMTPALLKFQSQIAESIMADLLMGEDRQ